LFGCRFLTCTSTLNLKDTENCLLIFGSNRRIDNEFNIFEGVTRNYLFIAVSLAMVGGQILIVFVGGKAFSVTRLSGAQWAYSVVLGALSIPVGAIIRLIPNDFVRRQTHLFTRHRPSNDPVELEVIER